MKNLFYSTLFMIFFSGTAFAQLSGERTVPSDDYPDLQTVADSLNLYGVGSGGVSFMLQGGSTFEESPIEFTATGNADDSIYIGWDGTGEKPSVNFEGTESDGEAGFTLTGVDNYTIDGLTITNSSSNIEFGILIANMDEVNGASNNTVQNVDITLDKFNAYQTVGISVAALTEPTAFEGNNHNNKFYNNSIDNVMMGYSLDGGTSTTEFMSVGNEINTQLDGESIIEDIILVGVVARDQNGFTLSNTTIRDLTQTTSSSPAGISTSSGNPSEPLTNDFVISNNTIENLTSSDASIFGMYLSARKTTYHIHNNKVHNVTATAEGGNIGNTADGIMVIASTVVVNMYNNMVSGVAAPASAVNNNPASRGITLRTYDLANLFYNTVLMDYEITNPDQKSAALVIYNNSDPVLLRNNIFVNKATLPEGGLGAVTAVYKRNNTLTSFVEGTDNNIYYAGEPGPQHLIYYGHNSSAPNSQETLADYKLAAATFDQNSYTEDVQFVAADDLHIPASANSVAQNNAMPVTDPIAVTTDFDGTLRDTTTPDIGADEIASSLPNVAINPNPEDGATDVSIELSELSWEYFDVPEYTSPIAFLVYLNDIPDFENSTPYATVTWDEGVTSYSAEIAPLSASTTYYWQVVPTTALVDGNIPEDVATWSFSTEAPLYPYPNPAISPIPADGSIIELADDHLISFGWSYFSSPLHSLPVSFALYGASDTNSVAWQTPIITVTEDDVLGAHSLGLTDNPNFSYEPGVVNFWKIVPIAANNQPALNVPVWTFTFDETIGLTNLEMEGTNIYPNPAVDYVHIEPGFDGKYEVMLYDVQGRQVQHFGEGEGKRSLNISSVQAGAYQLVIKRGDARFVNLIKVK